MFSSTTSNVNRIEITGITDNYTILSNSNQLSPLKLNSSKINYKNLSKFYSNINSFKSKSCFNNDVLISGNNKDNRIANITDVLVNNDDNITNEVYAQNALFFKNKKTIKIPSKVEHVIRKYIPRKLLKEIHEDVNVAIEMCLLFTTQLTRSYFGIKDGTNPDGWVSLKAEYLRDFICINPLAYKNVITALEYPLNKGQVIECDHHYIIGEKNQYYRLGKAYIGKGIVNYTLKTKEAINALNKHYLRSLTDANQNSICKNLIKIYADITLPTIEAIKNEAKRLIKKGYITKKGKILTIRNKHSNDYWKDADKRSFVEDAIEIYEYLTNNGLIIPMEGNEASGGRVIDSFTLMPGWIRKLVKINGKPMIECDYSALHPNIAVKLYNGKTEFITHHELASKLKIDVNTIKQEHLSFFNKEVWQMKQSPLYYYYSTHESKMLENIVREKHTSQYKHKITSRRMFEFEVGIMTEVIQQLNNEDIYVLYVYDALWSQPEHVERVKKVMDNVILRHGVKTTAKCTHGKESQTLIDTKEAKVDKSIIERNILSTEQTLASNITDCITVSANDITFSVNLRESILEKINKGEHPQFTDALIKFDDNDLIQEKVMVVYDEVYQKNQYITQSFIYNPLPAYGT